MLSYDADPVGDSSLASSRFTLIVRFRWIHRLTPMSHGEFLLRSRAAIKPLPFASSGNWASGLDIRGKAKTGADETATGELFQMRPYPSPGDILRMNADLSKPKSRK